METWWMHSPELGATCPRESNASIHNEWRLQEYWQHNWPMIRQAYFHYYHLIAIFASSIGQEGSEIIGALTQDEVFVYGLQFCLLLLFLYLMHLLRLWSSPNVVNEPPANIPEVTKELVCEFNFVSEQEKRATQEAAAEAMLELEEKRRRKRFTKKRKCCSAGPVLIASLRRQSQRPKRNTMDFEPLSPRDMIVEQHHLPPREKPLMVNLPPPVVVQQVETNAKAASVEHEDLDLATFVCVAREEIDTYKVILVLLY